MGRGGGERKGEEGRTMNKDLHLQNTSSNLTCISSAYQPCMQCIVA